MLKKLLTLGLSFVLLTTTISYVYAQQVNAFIYHRFGESRYPSTNISAEFFTQQLQYIKDKKIQVISLEDVAKLLKNDEPLPDHAVSFCVDDAFRSFYDVGMPIIRRLDIPVTLFVNTDAVGTSGYLTWDELRELSAEGVEIANHTATHAYLVELQEGETYSQWQERIVADIEKAQQRLQKHLGFKPTLFTYPFGEYSAAIVDIVKDLGFMAAFAQQSGVIHPQHNRFILPRFPMGGPFATLDSFKTKLKMKPLLVTNEDSFDPVIDENPPVLRIKISGKQVNQERFNCFVQGENSCRVVSGDDGWYEVIAENPLSGRRNKYTLTLQNKENDWLWYSHPWINAKNPARVKQ